MHYPTPLISSTIYPPQKAGHALLALGRIGKLASRDLFSTPAPSSSSSTTTTAAAAASASPSASSSSASPRTAEDKKAAAASPRSTEATTASSSSTNQKAGPLNGLKASANQKKTEMAAPEIVKEMVDVEVLEGDKARFDIKVKGWATSEDRTKRRRLTVLLLLLLLLLFLLLLFLLLLLNDMFLLNQEILIRT